MKVSRSRNGGFRNDGNVAPAGGRVRQWLPAAMRVGESMVPGLTPSGFHGAQPAQSACRWREKNLPGPGRKPGHGLDDGRLDRGRCLAEGRLEITEPAIARVIA